MYNFSDKKTREIIVEEFKKQIKSYKILFKETKNLNIIKEINKIEKKIKIFEK